MRTRLRLGAAASIGLGALLLATVLASPALAWHSTVNVSARCLDDQVRVRYAVEAWEKDHKATIDVFYQINGGEPVELESDRPLYNKYTNHFDLPNDTGGEITVTAITHWKDSDEGPSTNSDSTKLPKAGECKPEDSTTTTSSSSTSSTSSTTSTTTPTPSSAVAPTTSTQPAPTTTVAVGAATSTTGGGQLPFTGAGSSQPMLLAGIALVGGGALFLLLSRERRATR